MNATEEKANPPALVEDPVRTEAEKWWADRVVTGRANVDELCDLFRRLMASPSAINSVLLPIARRMPGKPVTNTLTFSPDAGVWRAFCGAKVSSPSTSPAVAVQSILAQFESRKANTQAEINRLEDERARLKNELVSEKGGSNATL